MDLAVGRANGISRLRAAVLITMILAALSVIYITTEEFAEAQSDGLARSYNVQRSDEDDSNGDKLSDSLLNGIVIVAVITAMTFLIVILYKYRCMKLLLAYMVLSSMLLLGFLASVMFEVAIDRYDLVVDKVSFWLFIYNFSVVGTMSIFYSRPFPAYITQAYLILTSVIVAWQLSFFDDWTAWVLLVLLALYDLYAVLTPCGPLKALVNLMSQEDAPRLPGLLYEAQLPRSSNRNTVVNTRRSSTQPRTEPEERTPAPPSDKSVRDSDTQRTEPTASTGIEMTLQDNTMPATESRTETSSSSSNSSSNLPESTLQQSQHAPAADPLEAPPVTHRIPLAIAKLYKLPLADDPTPPWRRGERPEYTPDELQSTVTAVFPARGGRVLLHNRQRRDHPMRYSVLDRHGVHKRLLFVDTEGKVMEDLREEKEDEKDRTSIRLGLGDFIFYSILVSKAALYSFTTFAACTLVILCGLGLTLAILAVRGHALPALPISIFLGVVFYLLTRYSMQPFIEDVFVRQLYV